MKNLYDVSENEKKNILEQHSRITNLTNNKLSTMLSEDNVQGGGKNAAGQGVGYHRDMIPFDTNKTVNFGKDKMKTGSDEVDVNSLEYLDLKDRLKKEMTNNNSTSPITVNVLGGASKVGSSSGYNNKALAKRRADKLVNQLRKDLPGVDKKFKFVTNGVVGTSTKLNSPEAYKEQFVNVSFSEPSTGFIKTSTETDNTAVNIPKFYDKTTNKIVNGGKLKRVCVQIPEDLVDEYRLMVREFKNDNKLTSIPMGVYDNTK